MPKGAKRLKSSLVAFALLLVLTCAAWLLSYDKESKEVEIAARMYLGDIKIGQIVSASHRIYPEDLLRLKEAAQFKAGVNEEFRREMLEYFQARDLDEVRSLPRQRFFEFLLYRTMRLYPDLFGLLASGRISGVKVRRHDDEAEARISVDVEGPSGKRRLSVFLRLAKSEGVWWVRI